MSRIGKRVLLGAAAVAVATLLGTASGVPGPVATAAAAPLGAQTAFETNFSAVPTEVMLVKDFKCCGKGGDGGLPPGPGGFKGGGKGGKGGNGGNGGNAGWGAAAAGAVILGMAHCAIQSERCEEAHGEDTDRYWRCMRRSGC